jgi:hypothetical protein
MRSLLTRTATLGVAIWLLIALPGSGPAGASAPLTLGLNSYGPLTSSSPAVRDHWLGVAAGRNAGSIRLVVGWSLIAPQTRRPGFSAGNPSDPQYAWGALDVRVRAYAAKHFRIVLALGTAPAWAEGSHPPAGTTPGTWRPQTSAFGQFASAAAKRYSGHYPDPLQPGRRLPRVRYWEAWNEPNLSVQLAPQWTRSRRHYVAASPVIYRNLLNAFYRSVKRVAKSNVVVAGATAPFGDVPGQPRMNPATFVQNLLCLRGARLRSAHCKTPAHFDVLDHHPFDIGGPLQPAVNPGDISVPDMGKLTRLLSAARRARTALPRGHKRLWAGELIWTSKPPDPGGVPLLRHARWLEQALFVLWRQGVNTVFWLQIADDANAQSTGLGGGLYFSNGRPKPAATAFLFPFVTQRQSSRQVRAWGRAPTTGRLSIQRRTGGHWVTVKRIGVRKSATFFVPLKLAGAAKLRARVGRVTSVTWAQG